jgi:hypothetical protein
MAVQFGKNLGFATGESGRRRDHAGIGANADGRDGQQADVLDPVMTAAHQTRNHAYMICSFQSQGVSASELYVIGGTGARTIAQWHDAGVPGTTIDSALVRNRGNEGSHSSVHRLLQQLKAELTLRTCRCS